MSAVAGSPGGSARRRDRGGAGRGRGDVRHSATGRALDRAARAGGWCSTAIRRGEPAWSWRCRPAAAACSRAVRSPPRPAGRSGSAPRRSSTSTSATTARSPTSRSWPASGPRSSGSSTAPGPVAAPHRAIPGRVAVRGRPRGGRPGGRRRAPRSLPAMAAMLPAARHARSSTASSPGSGPPRSPRRRAPRRSGRPATRRARPRARRRVDRHRLAGDDGGRGAQPGTPPPRSCRGAGARPPTGVAPTMTRRWTELDAASAPRCGRRSTGSTPSNCGRRRVPLRLVRRAGRRAAPTPRRRQGVRPRARLAVRAGAAAGRPRSGCPARSRSSWCTTSRCARRPHGRRPAAPAPAARPGRCSACRPRSWPATRCSRWRSRSCSSSRRRPARPRPRAARPDTRALIRGQVEDLAFERRDGDRGRVPGDGGRQDRRAAARAAPRSARCWPAAPGARSPRYGVRGAARARLPARRRPARHLGRPGGDRQAGRWRTCASARSPCRCGRAGLRRPRPPARDWLRTPARRPTDAVDDLAELRGIADSSRRPAGGRGPGPRPAGGRAGRAGAGGASVDLAAAAELVALACSLLGRSADRDDAGGTRRARPGGPGRDAGRGPGGGRRPVDAAVATAVAHLSGLQDPAGWWKGELADQRDDGRRGPAAAEFLGILEPEDDRARRPGGSARSSATTAAGPPSTAAPATSRRRSRRTSRSGSPATPRTAPHMRPRPRRSSASRRPRARPACSPGSGWRCSGLWSWDDAAGAAARAHLLAAVGPAQHLRLRLLGAADDRAADVVSARCGRSARCPSASTSCATGAAPAAAPRVRDRGRDCFQRARPGAARLRAGTRSGRCGARAMRRAARVDRRAAGGGRLLGRHPAAVGLLACRAAPARLPARPPGAAGRARRARRASRSVEAHRRTGRCAGSRPASRRSGTPRSR